VGALLVARQWERFVASANGLLTFEGLIGSALALVFVKAVHELAHGIAARRYGCRVPTMGVAFMLGYPLLYTDVSDAWRLTDRRQRVAIDVAGVAAELVLAVAATLLWVFLPDGVWRDACFFVAAVSWMMSVLVNLNPFMRFDGYYLLADAVNLPNLHARCSTLARNHIRRLLFGTALEADEPLSGSARRWLIAFAWALWLYRVALFVGIALIVYHATFKVLGIALFLVEIAFFIGRPLAREGAVWWRHRAQFLSRHEGRRTRWIAVGLMIAAFLPLPQRLHLPAIAVPHAQADVFPPADGRLLRLTVANGDEVTAGQVIAVVRSDDLLVARRRAEITLARLAAEARRVSSDDVDRAQTLVINREIAAARAEVSGLRARIARLTIQAPASGIVDGITAGLARGDHVSKTDRLLGIRSDTAARVIAFADDTERVRLTGEVAVFVPARFDARRLKLTRLGTTMQPVQSLEFDALARSYGGPIDVEPRDVRGRRQLRPTGALFRLPYAVVREDETSHATRYLGPGTVIASGTWRSLAYAVFEQVTFVLISESGL
ncbi:MAG: site-2 protease family protein, partial [Pseudomonadota bacterium]